MAIDKATTAKAVTSGTQLSSVGTVKTIVGQVKAVDANGAERVLQVGDKVYANETIITSADGGVIIEFPNGNHLDLPRSAHIMLDPEIYAASSVKPVEQEAQDEAARIARAIAEGRDPTAEAAAAAAGGEAGDEGTTTPLVIDFNNTQGEVTSGYPTGPISLSFPPPQEELPPTEPVAAPAPPVVPVPGANLTVITYGENEQKIELEALNIKEDSYGATLEIDAFTNDGTHLTQVVISGLNSSWTYDFSGLDTDGAGPIAVDLTQLASGVVIITGLSGTAYTGTFVASPPQDSDADLGTVSAVVTAVSDADPALSVTSAPDTASVTVDAVLDQGVAVVQDEVPSVNETGSGDNVISLNLDAFLAAAPFGYSGAGGSDSDSSENVTAITITISDGTLGLAAGYLGGATLVSNGSGSYTLSGWTNTADAIMAIEALQVTVPAYWDGQITGNIKVTTTEANTPQGTVSASGAELDITDNVVTNNTDGTVTAEGTGTDFSVTVNPTVSEPEVSLAPAANGGLYEDTQGALAFSAAPGGDDQITQIVISNVPADWTVGTVALNGSNYTSFTSSYDNGTLTIDVVGAVGTISGTFNVTPGAEDSSTNQTLSIAATAVDGSASATTSPVVNAVIVVDAVLDTFADVSTAAQSADESTGAHTYSLGITLNYAASTVTPATQADGTPADGNETFTATLKLNAALTGGATLYIDTTKGTLVPTGNANEWTISASSPANLELAVESLGISAPAGWDTNGAALTGTISTVSNDPAVDSDLTADNNTQNDSADFSVTVNAVQNLILNVADAAGKEDLGLAPDQTTEVSPPDNGDIPLVLSYSISDSNETLETLTISGIPVGVTITDGAGHTFTATSGSTSVDVAGWTLSGLKITALPDDSSADFDLTVTGVTSDGTAPSQTIHVLIDAVADVPLVTIFAQDANQDGDWWGAAVASGNTKTFTGEDGVVTVTATFRDSDGSESHVFVIDMPSVTVGNTTHTFTVSAANLTALAAATGVQGVTVLPNGDIQVTLVPTYSGTFNWTFNVSAPDITVQKNVDDPTPNAVVFGITATATENQNAASGIEVTTTDNVATASAITTAANILDGTLTTNTNVNEQGVILTFVDTATPQDSYAKLFNLNAQGQQGLVNLDTGFNIDNDEKYVVSVEHATGEKAIVTDMTLEGQTIVGQGNAQLDSLDGLKPFAFTSVITPNTSVNQPATDSTDGTSANQTNLADPSATTVNYLWGAAGNDVLNGSEYVDATQPGIDILNGGVGSDTLNGLSGNDILVYDPVDIIHGGDGFDTLRVDQGALALFNGADSTVDLDSTNKDGIEAILITDDATSSSTDGTNLILTAADVLQLSDNVVDGYTILYVNGNDGDTVDLSADAGEWTNPGLDATGHFNVWVNSTQMVKLYIENGDNNIGVNT